MKVFVFKNCDSVYHITIEIVACDRLDAKAKLDSCVARWEDWSLIKEEQKRCSE